MPCIMATHWDCPKIPITSCPPPGGCTYYTPSEKEAHTKSFGCKLPSGSDCVRADFRLSQRCPSCEYSYLS